MILEAILNIFLDYLSFIYSWIDLPDLPIEISNGITSFFELLSLGSSFIGFFLPGKIILPFFAVFSAIFGVDHLYPVIMWIIRKIPLSID